MLKKQHLLLVLLFLGIFIKPMEKSDSNNMALALGVGGVVATGIGLIGYRIYSSCKMKRQLCEDKGPHGNGIDIYSGADESGADESGVDESGVDEEAENCNIIRTHYEKEIARLPFFCTSDTNEEEHTTGVLQGIDASVKSVHIPTLYNIPKSKINIYSEVDESGVDEEAENYNKIKTHYEKVKSNLPYFGISDTNGKKYTVGVLRGIDESVKSEHIPTLLDIFKGRSGYNQLNDGKIKEVIERDNGSKYRSMGSKEFDNNLICGWLETRKGIKTIHLARCLNNIRKKESELFTKCRFLEAWIGNANDNSYEQLFESEKDGVQTLSREIKNKYSFIVCALFSSEYYNIITKSGCRKRHKKLYGQKIVSTVREMINNHTIQEIIPYPSLAFNGIKIEEDISSTITVVTFNNDELKIDLINKCNT